MREVGGVWLMGHVGRIQTSNQYHALTRIDEDDDGGEEEHEQAHWEVITKKKKGNQNKNGGKQNQVTKRKWTRLHTSPLVLSSSDKPGSPSSPGSNGHPINNQLNNSLNFILIHTHCFKISSLSSL